MGSSQGGVVRKAWRSTETVGASPPHTEETLEPMSPDFKSYVLLLQFPEVRTCPVTTVVIFYQRVFQTDIWHFAYPWLWNGCKWFNFFNLGISYKSHLTFLAIFHNFHFLQAVCTTQYFKNHLSNTMVLSSIPEKLLAQSPLPDAGLRFVGPWVLSSVKFSGHSGWVFIMSKSLDRFHLVERELTCWVS